MRIKLLTILFLFSIAVSARTYYVAPNGSNSNSGILLKPWATFQYAFNKVTAGDTVFFRGGIYYILTDQMSSSLKGTGSEPICFLNFPGEQPVIDGRNRTSSGNGMVFLYANHIKLRGITVRNMYQIEHGSGDACGIYFYRSNNVTIENCTTHDIGYRGFYFYDVDTLFVTNCDSYNVVDSLSVVPGNAGDGFIMDDSSPDQADIYDYAVFRGCRAWHVSDDGWDVHTEGYIELDNCWAFNCGGYQKFQYGNGFKLGLAMEIPCEELSRRVTNCLAAYNRGSGFTTNDLFAKPMELLNNTSAFNGTYGSQGFGFTINDAENSDEEESKRVFRNNLSFGNKTHNVLIAGGSTNYTHSNNTWDIPVSITENDFVSIDTTGLTGARKSDGSLPEVSFLKLVSSSGLIDKGINVGLPYYGSAPDPGYSEFHAGTITKPASPVYLSSEISNAAPSRLEMNYDLPLASIVPMSTAFTVKVNNVIRSIAGVSVSGQKVFLTLSSPAYKGESVTVSYAKPSTRYLQSQSGQPAESLPARIVINRITVSNPAPVIVVNYKSSSYSGFIEDLNASGTYDTNRDNLSFTWIAPEDIPVSSTNGQVIRYLSPVVETSRTVEFVLKVSDGTTTLSKIIPVEILPFKPDLPEVDFSDIEASSFQGSNYPYNIIDGNAGTMWAANGDNQWLMLRLEYPLCIDHILVSFNTEKKRESYFDILGSVDKIIWEPVLTITESCFFSGNPQVFEFPASKTQKGYNYIKLVGRCNSTDSWNYVSELKVFGYRYDGNSNWYDLPVKIYPNPVQQHVTIRIDDENLRPDYVQITDILGKVVFREEVDPQVKELLMPLSIKTGEYLIQLGTGLVILYSQGLIIIN